MPSDKPFHMKKLKNLIWVFAILLSSVAHGKNLFVALGGNDAGPGTQAVPLATIAKAATLSQSGDTVLIRKGHYVLNAQLSPTSGTSLARITYKAFNDEEVLIDGGTGYCLTLQFRSNLSFVGLKFTTSNTAVGAGMVYMENSDKCHFIDCEFYGMPPEEGRENTAVVRCMLTENGYSDSCVFRNNYFHDNQAPALRMYRTKGWIIENNEFRDCLQAVGGKDTPVDMLVQKNLIVDVKEAAFYFPGQSGANNVRITQNIVVNSGLGLILGGLGTLGAFRQNLYFYNNTFYNCYGFISGWDDAMTRNFQAWNNIVYSDTAYNIHPGSDMGARIINMNRWGKEVPDFDTSNYAFHHNCIQLPQADNSNWFIVGNKSYKGLEPWRLATGFEKTSISAEPLFVNADNEDFHLQHNSPCRKSGTDGLNMGAYPYDGSNDIIGVVKKTVVTSVDEEEQAMACSYAVGPNPLKEGAVSITCSSTQVYQLRVYNVWGQLVYTDTDIPGSCELSKSLFANAGIYTLSFTGPTGIYSHRLVVE